MAIPESDPQHYAVFSALVEAQRKYELTEQIENPIERFFVQEQMLLEMDNLQAELEELSTKETQPNTVSPNPHTMGQTDLMSRLG